MPYIRSRKFCCCLPVRFGVICEALLGLGVGGFYAIASWLEISSFMKATVEFSSNQKTAIWVLAVVMTLFALTSLLGLVGSIGRMRALVGFYAGALAFVTLLNIVGGIYFIFNLFASAGEEIAKCDAQVEGGSTDATHFACSQGFKAGRTVVIIVYVLFWLIEIYGCVIAFSYLTQLNEEKDAERNSEYEKPQGPAQNVTIVTQPQYAFTAEQNAHGAV